MTTRRDRSSPAARWGAVCIAATALGFGGCSSGLPSLPKIGDLNPFAETQKPLEGKRIAVLQTTTQSLPGELAAATQPIVLPAPQVNDGWTQPGGTPTNAPGHLLLANSIKQSWSANAGTGSSSAGRVTAPPIVSDGRVFVLDAASNVTAFSLASGASSWKISLLPETEKASGGLFSLGGSTNNGGYGGGLAIDGGQLIAASGFGVVTAHDPASGKKLWERNLGKPIRAAPTASDGRVYVVTIDGRFYCLSGVDGTQLWISRGLPQQASLVMSTSPATDGETVVVPYPSGDLAAVNVADGAALWSESLTRSRATSRMESLSDTARPAIADGIVYAVSHSGRMVATDMKTGERRWSLTVPGTQAPMIAGDTIYVVDTGGQLMAVSRDAGQIQWTVKLPDSKTWSGPVLAGNQLWLASDKGQLINVDAATGRVAGQQSLGEPVYIAPIVAQGRLLVLTDRANLIALN